MLAERDTQYSLADLIMIAADMDPQPEIKLEAGGKRLNLRGTAGFRNNIKGGSHAEGSSEYRRHRVA